MKTVVGIGMGMLLVIGTIGINPVQAEEMKVMPAQEVEEVTGVIQGINTDDSILSLKVYTDAEMESYSMEDVYVLQEAIIERNGESISLDGLAPEERITARYLVSPDGRKEADRIWVK